MLLRKPALEYKINRLLLHITIVLLMGTILFAAGIKTAADEEVSELHAILCSILIILSLFEFKLVYNNSLVI